MLHEALPAKLIAIVYDEIQSTDFNVLYGYYNGWGTGELDSQQELEMIQNYADEMAVALREFDQTQGIEQDLDFYKEALKYTFSTELKLLPIYETGEDEYYKLYYSSKKCN
ncbi:MAG: hypothetical protein GXO47_10945 [Chlorobi bacterium]|nr:hypothetical protein [Chlorobiota bacterium]